MASTNPFLLLFGIVVVVVIFNAVVIVRQNHRGAVVRLGRYMKSLGPGLHVRVPLIDLVTQVDLEANIPGWQGLSERELEAAIESFVTVGSVTGAKSARSRRADSPPAASGAFEAEALAAWLLKKASDDLGVDLSNDQMAKNRIGECARTAVEALRTSGSYEVNLPFLTADQNGPKHFSFSLTRSQVNPDRG
jgi:regulator of protease activity HflC (stomatin/prohibitin superfamily)